MYMCRGVCLQACPFIRPYLLDKIDNNINGNIINGNIIII